ncbi:MAG: YdeI family protein [Pseudonocardiaceae bacterium]
MCSLTYLDQSNYSIGMRTDCPRVRRCTNEIRSAICEALITMADELQEPVAPTSLSYKQALEEALCHGWIDGQVQRRDQTTYRQRFTPRRARSPWSARNVGIVSGLVAAGRMHPSGVAEVERAKADGRWDAAYAGPANIEVPADLSAALTAEPRAQATDRSSFTRPRIRRPVERLRQ